MNNLILSYGGVSPPPFFIAEKIEPELLPSITIDSIDVPQKSGSYFINKKYGVRTFSIPFTIVADDDVDVTYKADILSKWLDYDEPQKLVFRDNPSRYYMAIINGNTDYTRSFQLGRGTLEFICYDPHAYGEEQEVTLTPQNEEPVSVINDGNMDASPKIEMTFTKNVTDFSIMTPDDAIIFGDFDPTTQTAVNLKPLVVNETGASINLWTNGLSVDGGTVAGEMRANGYSFQQKDKDYGTGSKWHGASLIRSLNKEVQDFTCEAQVLFSASKMAQMGRVVVYLLDTNLNKIGTMAIKDYQNGEYPMFECLAGQFGNGHKTLISSYGDRKGVFRQFNGIIRIERIGKEWKCHIAQVDPKTKVHHTRMSSKPFSDYKNLYNKKVAAVQIHVAQFGTIEPTNLMAISNVKFTERLEPQDNEVDYSFRAGDTLSIDCKTGEVLVNGEPNLENFYPSSSWLKLKQGVTAINVSDSTAIENIKVSYQERWL
ncbi:distal tail protein Dit [Priestia megaterium]|uniref:distal tail protein Dit n=1 Tax=Priestia megaterium TaxID=1404 RepID=UPI000BF467BA|nr:distal tail protein Dit [Priestia megaterium]PFK01979.1 hypothetical protein COI96_06195 [Priestia megaterium]PMD08154.1 phage tail family protein [Priestia megaterium]